MNISMVIDRDDRTDVEVEEEFKKGVRVLSMRQIENYLYDDEVLKKLCESVGQLKKYRGVLAAKATALKASIARGNPADDIKSASGSLSLAIKKILNLQHPGSTSEAFCRDTLAPLITADMKVYKILKKDIFGL